MGRVSAARLSHRDPAVGLTLPWCDRLTTAAIPSWEQPCGHRLCPFVAICPESQCCDTSLMSRTGFPLHPDVRAPTSFLRDWERLPPRCWRVSFPACVRWPGWRRFSQSCPGLISFGGKVGKDIQASRSWTCGPLEPRPESCSWAEGNQAPFMLQSSFPRLLCQVGADVASLC